MKGIRNAVCCVMALALFTLSVSGCTSNNEKNGSESTDSTDSTEDTSGAEDTTVTEEFTSQVLNYEDMSVANVMSFNIYYKDVTGRAEDIIDFIHRGNADVMGLQEVSVDWRDYLNEALIHTGKYACYGYGRYGGEWSDEAVQSGDQWSLILYKPDVYELIDSGHFWCSSTPEMYSSQWSDGTVSDFPRSINWVMLRDKETGSEFVFVNAHLDPDNETVRINSAVLIVDMMRQIADGRLCVMVGDWNSGLTKPTYAYITSNGFSDVRFTAEETTDIGTFQDWGQRDESSWAYGDIIFASVESAKVKMFNVLTDTYDGVFISDHCPIVAKIYY